MAKKTDPIKAYRESNGLSQQEVADKLGCSRQMVGLLELGERNYTEDMAMLIEKRLGIPRSDVLPRLFAGYVPRRIAA